MNLVKEPQNKLFTILLGLCAVSLLGCSLLLGFKYHQRQAESESIALGSGVTTFTTGNINAVNVTSTGNLSVTGNVSSTGIFTVSGAGTSTFSGAVSTTVLSTGAIVWQRGANTSMVNTNGTMILTVNSSAYQWDSSSYYPGQNNAKSLGRFGNAWSNVMASGTYFGLGLTSPVTSTVANSIGSELLLSRTSVTSSIDLSATATCMTVTTKLGVKVYYSFGTDGMTSSTQPCT